MGGQCRCVLESRRGDIRLFRPGSVVRRTVSHSRCDLISHDSELVQWLWPDLIQRELDALRERFNSHKVRRDRNKKLPSGVSPNVAYAMPDRYNAIDCLQQVDVAVIQEIMDAIGGEDLIRFVSTDYAARAQQVFDLLRLPPVTLHNVWEVFQKMMPILHPQ